MLACGPAAIEKLVPANTGPLNATVADELQLTLPALTTAGN